MFKSNGRCKKNDRVSGRIRFEMESFKMNVRMGVRMRNKKKRVQMSAFAFILTLSLFCSLIILSESIRRKRPFMSQFFKIL